MKRSDALPSASRSSQVEAGCWGVSEQKTGLRISAPKCGLRRRNKPLVFEHINLLGRYAFSVPEAVARGELRPLRNPAEVLEEVA
jgi:hypothetical protein